MKKNDKLTNYFNAAKNSGEEFTQNELQRIVETSSDENERGLSFTNTNNWKGILFMTTLALTLITSTLGILIGIGSYSNSSAHSKTVQIKNGSEVNSTNKTEPSTTQAILSLIAKQYSQKKTNASKKGFVRDNAKKLDIEGITTINLTKEELTKLGIIIEKDCGISSFTVFSSGTYYNANKIKSENTINKIKSDNDWKEGYYSIWKMPTSEIFVKKNFPLLTTSMNGTILSNAMGKVLKNDTSPSLNTENSNDDTYLKPTLTFYKYPNDTTSVEEMQKIMSDTSNYYITYKTLTPAEVEQMKKDNEVQTDKINEYLKLNKLVAIKVDADCPDNSLVFWFEPTLEFIQSLPERYMYPLHKEVFGTDTIMFTLTRTDYDSLTSKENTVEHKSQTGCQFSDICRATSGAVLETSVFPNPASESLSLKFTLNESRKCSFSIHDLNGTYIRELSEEVMFGKGDHTSTMDIHDIKAGIYLVSMITNMNERIVQRVIVKK